MLADTCIHHCLSSHQGCRGSLSVPHLVPFAQKHQVQAVSETRTFPLPPCSFNWCLSKGSSQAESCSSGTHQAAEEQLPSKALLESLIHRNASQGPSWLSTIPWSSSHTTLDMELGSQETRSSSAFILQAQPELLIPSLAFRVAQILWKGPTCDAKNNFILVAEGRGKERKPNKSQAC